VHIYKKLKLKERIEIERELLNPYPKVICISYVELSPKKNIEKNVFNLLINKIYFKIVDRLKFKLHIIYYNRISAASLETLR